MFFFSSTTNTRGYVLPRYVHGWVLQKRTGIGFTTIQEANTSLLGDSRWLLDPSATLPAHPPQTSTNLTFVVVPLHFPLKPLGAVNNNGDQLHIMPT